MARVNAQEYVTKWQTRSKAAAPDYRAGIERVSEAPGQKAAAQADAMAAGVLRAIQEGTWQRQVASVSLADWKERTLAKGPGRIAAGVDAAAPKMQAKAAALLAAVDEAVAVTNRTPRGDLETNIGRMNTFVREMAARAPKRQG